MRVNSFSKQFIALIALVTVLSVIIVGYIEQQVVETVAQPVPAKQEAEQKHNEALINSLTNMTQSVRFPLNEHAIMYTGYILGAGYSSYQFRAFKDQKLKVNLKGDASIDLALFGQEAYSLQRDTEYVIPSEGLYELRVLFKTDMESRQEQAAIAHKATPVPYTITINLQ
ncbi:hypothetical protein ACVFVO_12995 [Advenella kashmirensis]